MTFSLIFSRDIFPTFVISLLVTDPSKYLMRESNMLLIRVTDYLFGPSDESENRSLMTTFEEKLMTRT